METEKKRRFEEDFDKLADEGISCSVEGDVVVCTGEILKREKIEIPTQEFSAEKVRAKLAEKGIAPTE